MKGFYAIGKISDVEKFRTPIFETEELLFEMLNALDRSYIKGVDIYIEEGDENE